LAKGEQAVEMKKEEILAAIESFSRGN